MAKTDFPIRKRKLLKGKVKVMENEKKENVSKVKEIEKLYLEREKFTGRDGREFWSYYVAGKVRNRDLKIDFIPKDKGGYEPLDIIFEIKDKAELIFGKETMTGSDGKVTKYDTYKVSVVDTDGVVYECGVKPSRDSDKALFNMLLNTLHIVVGEK